jgi:citrate/tricarballylate utilization protein
MSAAEAIEEADRLMTVCNSCRYCEGLCAVFPAMEMRDRFAAGDLNYLSNLCHACGACYVDCQFSPPHEFNVNVPKVLAEVRNNSYAAYAWPRAFAGLFERNGLVIALVAALSVAGFIAGFAALNDPDTLFGAHSGPGAFYKLMSHNAMAALFGAAFLYAILAIALGLRAFWRDSRNDATKPVESESFWQATKDAGQLRYLGGGGSGCAVEDKTDARTLFHHLTFYGFLLCFAATSVATLYHYLLGRIAPYPWYDLPVVLGTVGGIGLLIGPVGLLIEKHKRGREMQDSRAYGMEAAFLWMLFLVSATGLALLAFRETSAMGLLLALHLGMVFGFMITMPYGKFMHGLYRFAALARYAQERRNQLLNASG